MFSSDSQVSRSAEVLPPSPKAGTKIEAQIGSVEVDSKPSLEEKDGLKLAPTVEKEIAQVDKEDQLEAVELEEELVEEKRSQSWQVAPNLFSSFRYAWAGISYAFQTQRNFRIHTAVGSLAMVLCWLFKVSNLEIAIICLTIGAVLVMEILNTALESLVDLTVGQAYHDLAKIAKDCAAGAVLMAAIVALLIAMLIFAPPLWAILSPFISSILSI
ncbi:MAG: diacylglycerol kinase family protein [Cyanobacteria bacterium P01_D01_bin.1]